MNVILRQVFTALPLYRAVNETTLPDTKKANLWDSLVTSPSPAAFAEQLHAFNLPPAEHTRVLAFRQSYGPSPIGATAIMSPWLLVGVGRLLLMGIICILGLGLLLYEFFGLVDLLSTTHGVLLAILIVLVWMGWNKS